MLQIKKTLDIVPTYDLSNIAPLERIVFFDIETTGLSASRASLYLIGAVHHTEEGWQLLQWFSEGLEDEEALVHSFFSFLSEKKRAAKEMGGAHASVVLLHFNGETFDMPYLLKVVGQYRLPYSFSGILSIDLFQKIKPYRSILGLPNCKLKTVEQFFGISREDRFSGGELIYVYEEYLRLRNLDPESCEYLPQNLHLRDQLLKTLLLHNEEDMANLPMVCGLLAYDELFCGHFRLQSAALVETGGQTVLDLHFDLPGACEQELDLADGPYTICAGKDLNLTVALCRGELKYFFPDYKNYYYLPEEDYAVHKSVGEFVSRSARKQASAKTCYQKKYGLFLPEPEAVFEPVFYREYKGAERYAAYTEDMALDRDRLRAYGLSVLSRFLRESRKKK